MGRFVGLLSPKWPLCRAGNLGAKALDSSVDFVDDVMCVAYGCGFGEAIVVSDLNLDGFCGLAISGHAGRGFGAYFFMDTLAEGGSNELWDLFISHVGP